MSSYDDLWDKQAPARVHKPREEPEPPKKAGTAKKATKAA